MYVIFELPIYGKSHTIESFAMLRSTVMRAGVPRYGRNRELSFPGRRSDPGRRARLTEQLSALQSVGDGRIPALPRPRHVCWPLGRPGTAHMERRVV